MPIDRNSAQYITGAIYKPTQTSAPGVWDLDDQANNLSKNLWPLPPQAVQRSLRFNTPDSAYLNRTPAVAGNRKLWTYSCWIKRSASGASYILVGEGSVNDEYTYLQFDSNDLIYGVIGVVGANPHLMRTVAAFRDYSSWYHIVSIFDTDNAVGADRWQIWVNGVKQSLTVTNTMSQGFASAWINNNSRQLIGRRQNYSVETYSNYYLAEVNFVDGQQLTPSSFGETDAQTGVWIPKRYTGTYGTNGFRLSFANNSSITALGYDSSGQGNNWTPNNFSITPGVGNDVFVDVPSLYGTDTRLGGEVLGNYCTLNPLSIRRNFTLSNGNLDGINNGSNDGGSTGTLATPTTGKWYWEMILTGINGGIYLCYTGLVSQPNFPGGSFVNVPGCLLYPRSGNVCFYDNAGNAVCITETAYNGDVYGLAYDADTGLVDFYKNGLKYSGYSVTVTTGINYWPAFFIGNQGPTASINFGQRPFAYPAPTGYKALCTTNLPAPAIGQTSSNQADNHFAAVTYTGNGGTQTISTLDFQPDLVWIKRRDSNWSHAVYDSIRGAGSLKALSTNATDAEGVFNADTTYGYLSSFNNNGFTVVNGSTGGYTNFNNATYVAWCWKKSRAAGLDVVTATANASAAVTYNHSLGVAPAFVISKSRSATVPWLVYHKSLGVNQYLLLNTSDAATTLNGVYSSSLSQFSITSQTANASYVAYMFAEIPGFSAFGSYTGNGSTDGPFVYTGFRPKWIMVKQSAGTSAASGSWQIFDTARDLYNPSDYRVQANSSGVEGTGAPSWDVLSNGFKLRSLNANWNETSGTYVYAAFAETPARLSTAR